MGSAVDLATAALVAQGVGAMEVVAVPTAAAEVVAAMAAR